MVEVVYRPVQYILGIPKDAISAACTALGSAANGAASQTGLIEAIHAGLASGVDTGLATEQLSSIPTLTPVSLAWICAPSPASASA